MPQHPFPRTRALALAMAFCAAARPGGQDAPGVTGLTPAHGASDVDAKATKQLVVTFDRAMSDTGHSFCGGGPKFPKFLGKPQWRDAKTMAVDVELEPDHEYEMSLNCPAATNFRSAAGVALAPVPWSFSTRPEKLLPPAEQRARNQKALNELTKALATRYSYYDLRVKDWGKLVRDHTQALHAAKTDRAWAAVAAKMLAAAQDLHLYLRCAGQTFGTGSRAVDPLFRKGLLQNYVATRPAGNQARYGRTADGIGYLLIGTWSDDLDVDAVETALEALRDTKALIVDVRPNSGGNELLAQRIAAWFVDGRKVYARNRYRTGPGKTGFGPVIDRPVTGNRDETRRYTKPIVVLQSRYVMSSNESFVMMLDQARDCTRVGQPTFGSSGNPKPHDLGNGVTVVMPSWQDLRLDGTCLEGEGIAPDILVEVGPQDLEQKDPILERALEVLRAKLE